jgi:hypothetical protein
MFHPFHIPGLLRKIFYKKWLGPPGTIPWTFTVTLGTFFAQTSLLVFIKAQVAINWLEVMKSTWVHSWFDYKILIAASDLSLFPAISLSSQRSKGHSTRRLLSNALSNRVRRHCYSPITFNPWGAQHNPLRNDETIVEVIFSIFIPTLIPHSTYDEKHSTGRAEIRDMMRLLATSIRRVFRFVLCKHVISSLIFRKKISEKWKKVIFPASDKRKEEKHLRQHQNRYALVFGIAIGTNIKLKRDYTSY